MMRVLWILPKWPFPAIDGATKAHMALLQNWPKTHPLDLVIYTNTDKTEEEIKALKKIIGFENLLLLPYKNTPRFLLILTSLFSSDTLPTTVKRFMSLKAKKLWQAWSANKVWDVMVLDGLHPGALFCEKSEKNMANFTKKTVLRAHNVESELWEQTTERAPFFVKWIYKKEKKRMQSFENRIFSMCNLIVPVSDADAHKIQKQHPQTKTQVAPIGMHWEQKPHPIAPSKTLDLLFIGRLDWYPNVEGLRWFLDEIWPIILIKKNKQIRLHIVGSYASNALKGRLTKIDNVLYHGKVSDLAPYYHQVALTIIPILTGSGTRVKAIESAQYGRSFISTTKGIEGVSITDTLDFIEANTKEEWIFALNSLSLENCSKMGANVHDKIKVDFDCIHIQKQFIGFLDVL